jgi:hypothetical protein
MQPQLLTLLHANKQVRESPDLFVCFLRDPIFAVVRFIFMRNIIMAHGPGTAQLLQRIAQVTAARPTLDVSGLQLTSLPALPPILTTLYCFFNQLTELPALPPTLDFLYCNRNQLTELPALPPALKRLVCSHNRLSRLPDLPPALENLYCQANQITVLPALPGSLKELACNSNPISKITSEFPPGVRDLPMRYTFAETQLQFLPEETLEQYYFAPPRVDEKGNAIPGGPGYVDTTANYDSGQKKFGGLRRKPKRTRRTRKRKHTRRSQKLISGKVN